MENSLLVKYYYLRARLWWAIARERCEAKTIASMPRGRPSVEPAIDPFGATCACRRDLLAVPSGVPREPNLQKSSARSVRKNLPGLLKTPT